MAAVRVDGALAVPARRDERDAAARAAFFRVAVAVRVPAVCIFAFFFFPLVFFPFFGALVLTTGADFALRSAERLVFVAERLLAADRALSRERAAVA